MRITFRPLLPLSPSAPSVVSLFGACQMPQAQFHPRASLARQPLRGETTAFENQPCFSRSSSSCPHTLHMIRRTHAARRSRSASPIRRHRRHCCCWPRPPADLLKQPTNFTTNFKKGTLLDSKNVSLVPTRTGGSVLIQFAHPQTPFLTLLSVPDPAPAGNARRDHITHEYHTGPPPPLQHNPPELSIDQASSKLMVLTRSLSSSSIGASSTLHCTPT